MLRQRHILLISLLILLTFANSFFNGFIGDSKALILHSDFYSSPVNLKKLVTPGALSISRSHFEPALVADQPFSGMISYRPFTALSFFVDYALWQRQAWGYHVTNVLLHLVVTLLVYGVMMRLVARPLPALMTALVFGLHPIHTEVVNSIGYRSDLLAGLFLILSFWSYLTWSRTPDRTSQRRTLLVSGGTFFLALLAKETAVVLPVLLVAHDILFVKTPEEPAVRFLKQQAQRYAVYLLPLALYLVLYVLIFPSAHYSRSLALIPGWGHAVVVFKILGEYLRAFLVPFTVKVLPPLYGPAVAPFAVAAILLGGAVVLGSLGLAYGLRRRQPLAAFGIIWFWLTYLPAAHILPLPNPMAYRFMYLPAMGLAMTTVVLFARAFTRVQARLPSFRWAPLLRLTLVAMLMSVTIGMNAFYKNDFSYCREALRRFPDSSRPWWNLGVNFYDLGKFEQARYCFEQYLRQDPRNPFVPDPARNYVLMHSIGRCYVQAPEQALPFFEKALALEPDYILAYLDGAKAAILLNRYDRALHLANESLRREPRASLAYVYAVHSLIRLGDPDGAGEVLQRLKTVEPGNAFIPLLEQQLKSWRSAHVASAA